MPTQAYRLYTSVIQLSPALHVRVWLRETILLMHLAMLCPTTPYRADHEISMTQKYAPNIITFVDACNMAVSNS